MILSALVEYYGRRASDRGSRIPRFGWSEQRIGFVIVLGPDGSLHAIDAPPVTDARAAKRFTLTVPGQSKPSGAGINPCFLWDNAAYALGLPPKDRDSEWAWQRFEAFRGKHLERDAEVADPGFSAVCAFLKSWSRASLEDESEGLAAAQGFCVFRLRGASEYVHERDAVVAYWNHQVSEFGSDRTEGTSLVSGEVEQLARLHEPKIKRVRGSRSSGALLASFNLDAFDSYGKEQGYNAPVGEMDAFRYCTALNALLADDRRRAQIGDATAVFWAARAHPIEDITGAILAGTEDEATVRRVKAFLTSLEQGTPESALEDAATRFFVLGLAPNASRLAVRFWLEGTVGELAERLRQHASALEIGGEPEGYRIPSIRRLVEETAVAKGGWPDSDRVSPVLAGEVARAILAGLPYPRSLLVGVIQRLRAEGFVDAGKRNQWRHAMHRRASILKACLVRRAPHLDREIHMTLNEDHPKASYQFGRLFAVLEKTQEEALGDKVNASIRDRYLGAASATPSTVFPRLWRLHAHHLRKLGNVGRRVNLERLVASICSKIESIPTHLPIEGQGLFFLGYYQQRQELYTKKKDADAVPADA